MFELSPCCLAQLLEERAALEARLQAETDLYSEAEEMRLRLEAKHTELEEVLREMEARLEEEEERAAALHDHKRELEQQLQVDGYTGVSQVRFYLLGWLYVMI